MFNMNSSKASDEEVAGQDKQSAAVVKRLRTPKRARRAPGRVGLINDCLVCGAGLLSIGLGRPKEYCEGCLGEVNRLRWAAYYEKNRRALLDKLKAKRRAKKGGDSESGQAAE